MYRDLKAMISGPQLLLALNVMHITCLTAPGKRTQDGNYFRLDVDRTKARMRELLPQIVPLDFARCTHQLRHQLYPFMIEVEGSEVRIPVSAVLRSSHEVGREDVRRLLLKFAYGELTMDDFK